MKNSILFIGATHGDEPIGVDVLNELRQERSDFDWIIGNEKAFPINTRTYTADLNRSAPGNLNSPIYEQRRSAELIALSNTYTYTIDLHGTDNDMDTFIIICNPKQENLELAALIDIPRIVIWPAISEELKNPSSEFFACGLEIECGNQSAPATATQLTSTLATFLDTYKNASKQEIDERLQQREIYQVYDVLRSPSSIDPSSLTEFARVDDADDEPWYPLFIDAYNDIICYKMERVSVEDILS